MSHRRVEGWREEERHPDFVEGARSFRPGHVHLHAQRLEYIGGARLTANRPVTVLRHPTVAPAAMNAAVVEMLKVEAPSPPVPQVSSSFG